ncbi:MAG TPA: LuxR C-terminal-related transcriptional regulator, partial [Candidatus Eremiobacteraceae bacterium]|nr:LuxR C-terminal-related transcriptional regulator [Candidatus Eremiobacteraceae bacterium]
SRRAELNLKLAKALHQSGFGERAKEAATTALVHYESTDTQRAAQICLDLAQLCFDLSDYAAVGQFAQRALALIDGDPTDPIFFAAQVELMALHTHSWDPEKARYHMKQAELFVGSPPVAAKIRFLQSKTAIEACTGFPERALDQTKAGAALAATSNDFRSALRIWDSFATGMAQIGEREYALLGFDEAQGIVDRHNVGGLSARWLSIDLAQAQLQFGDLQKASQLVEQALAAGIDLPAFRLAVAETGILAGLWLEHEDLVVRCAQPDLVDFALQSSDAAALCALASYVEWHAAQGRPGEARALLRRAVAAHQAIKSKTGPGDIYKLLVSMAAHGDDDDARQSRTILEQTARTLIVRSSPAYLALIDAYIIARTSNRSKDEMNEPALEAARMFSEIGWPHYQAQALELAGKKEEALFTYRSIGDVRDAKRLESALAPPTRHGRAANELTAREREILELMLTGQTNRAIAQTLVISERTVENHVSAILAKCQVASRAELIAKRKGTPTLKGDSS